MHVHLVFVTKYRKKVFSKQILADLKDIFTSICLDFECMPFGVIAYGLLVILLEPVEGRRLKSFANILNNNNLHSTD